MVSDEANAPRSSKPSGRVCHGRNLRASQTISTYLKPSRTISKHPALRTIRRADGRLVAPGPPADLSLVCGPPHHALGVTARNGPKSYVWQLPSTLTVRADGHTIRVGGHVAEVRGASTSLHIELVARPSPVDDLHPGRDRSPASYAPPVAPSAAGGVAVDVGGAVGGGALGGGGIAATETAAAAPTSPSVSPAALRMSRSTPPRVYDPRLAVDPFASRRWASAASTPSAHPHCKHCQPLHASPADAASE